MATAEDQRGDGHVAARHADLISTSNETGQKRSKLMKAFRNVATRFRTISTSSQLQRLSNDEALRILQPNDFYQPLRNKLKEIRLLKLSPGTGADIIQCTLVHTSLDNCQPYRAISYTWGRPSNLQSIQLNGKSFQIRKNAYDVLIQLRSQSKPQFLWIDAICINQLDAAERSIEITKMKMIFSKAINVVIWIGSSHDSSGLAFTLIRLLYENRGSREDLVRIIEDPNHGEHLDALVNIFRRRYWRRVWVVQEIASALQPVVQCGPDTVDWKVLLAVSDVFAGVKPSVREAFDARSDVDSVAKTSWLAHDGPQSVSDRVLRSRNSPLPDFPTPIHLLAKAVPGYIHLFSTDPRDKIYGLIGLVADPESLNLDVNYESTVEEVYTNFIKAVVSTTLELDIICSPRPRIYTYHLPSWAPDWRYKQESSKLRRILSIATTPRYASGKGSQAVCSFRKDSNNVETMTARGFSIDKIRITGGPAHIKDRETMEGVVRSFAEWRAVFIDDKGDDLKEYKNFFQTISCSYIWALWNHSDDMNMQYFLHAVTKTCPKTPTDEILLETWESAKSSYNPSFTEEDHATYGVRLIYELRKHIIGRRFFVSSSGTMGMAPAEAEVGDEVCILLGCSCPVILRPHNDGEFYTLVGETYLRGHMNGKGMDDLEEGKFTMKDFEIQ